MQRLTETIIRSEIRDVFTDVDVAAMLGEASNSRRYALVKRALASGEIVRIKRGIYILAEPYRKGLVNLFEVASKIYGLSYIGLESALVEHGWIPEHVFSVVCGVFKRSRTFDTPLGRFAYRTTPFKTLVGVNRVETEPGGAYLLSSPLRALADLYHEQRWEDPSIGFLTESLRIDSQLFLELNVTEFEHLLGQVAYRPVRQFLINIREELDK
jgi:hypothetical protein